MVLLRASMSGALGVVSGHFFAKLFFSLTTCALSPFLTIFFFLDGCILRKTRDFARLLHSMGCVMGVLVPSLHLAAYAVSSSEGLGLRNEQ